LNKLRRSMSSRVFAVAPVACACALLCAPPVHAALGKPYASVAADQVKMKASVEVTPTAAYEVHALTLPTGTVVREYVSATGTVFAVAWSGPFKPNLRQALGDYFADYVSAAQTKFGGHNHLFVSTPTLVIQSNGHMRAFSGRAYLVQAIPAGVSTDELR
jgi:hypothetical protein